MLLKYHIEHRKYAESKCISTTIKAKAEAGVGYHSRSPFLGVHHVSWTTVITVIKKQRTTRKHRVGLQCRPFFKVQHEGQASRREAIDIQYPGHRATLVPTTSHYGQSKRLPEVNFMYIDTPWCDSCHGIGENVKQKHALPEKI